MDGNLYGEIASRWNHPDTQRRGVLLGSAVLAVLCLWLLVRIAFTVLTPVASSTELHDATQPQRSAQPTTQEVGDLGRWHLFGAFQPDERLTALRNAPVTNMPLELRGIVAGSDPESGYAIIYSEGRQAVYGIGEVVAGDARVRAIYPDRVLLNRDGMHETLRLPQRRPENQGATAPVENAAIPAAATRAEPPETPTAAAVPGIAQLLGSQGRNALGIGLVPVSGGGFRLFLARDAGAVTQLGLRNGDVILMANGVALTSEADVERAVEGVLGGDPLKLTIRRGGEVLTLNPDLSSLQ